jgi:hypothetical protein
MPDSRRYQEDEVREIFDRAIKEKGEGSPTPDPAEGLTLEELQDIGMEVGLSPDRIAEAATAVDVRRNVSPRRTHLGMPISVERVVDLPRPLTDREWDLLVTELRQTFDASGRVGGAGGARHWNNGNLHAYVEPTAGGYRLRMTTLKGIAQPRTLAGIGALAVAAILAMIIVLDSGVGRDLIGPLMIALMGTGALGANALGLPAWAREREGQMEYIAATARAMVEGGQKSDSETEEPGPS